MSHVQNDTRKIVKLKDVTKGIARTMVLDLRPFDIVESVGFNELFILIIYPFPNPNSFGNPDKFENLEIFGYPPWENFVFPIELDISGFHTPLVLTYCKRKLCFSPFDILGSSGILDWLIIICFLWQFFHFNFCLEYCE